MRNVDYWCGVPLCFLLSGLNNILKAINFKKIKTRPVRKVLFIKLSELGAVILSYPLLRRVKREFPQAELLFLTFEKNKEVFSLLDGIVTDSKILTIRDSLWPFVCDAFRIVKKIKREKVDVVFDLEFFSRFTAILTFLIKADKKIGFHHYTYEGLYRGNFLTHRLYYNPMSHISRIYLSLAQVIKKDSKDTQELEERIDNDEISLPRYISKSSVKDKVISRLKDYGINKANKAFLINPGEGILPIREWPVENFIALSRRILEDDNNYLVIIGTLEAKRKGELILKSVNNSRCISLIGQTTLDELMELFYIADVLIANDCGLAHLASLTPIKKLILFGPESPRVFSPLGEKTQILYSDWPCSPCLSAFNHRNSVCADNKCLKAISPQDVYSLIRSI